MNQRLSIALAALAAASLVPACSSKPAATSAGDVVASQAAGEPRAQASAAVPTADADPGSVWVTKPDGGKQCESGTGLAVDEGADGLKKAGVTVLEARKRDDGKMRIQMCGAPAGKENAYKIRRADLEKALALGYREATSAMRKSPGAGR